MQFVAKDVDGGGQSAVDLTQNTVTMTDNGGRVVRMDLGQGDVHLDKTLANFCAGFKLVDGIADEVCPVVMVDKASDKYRTWEKDDLFAAAADLTVAPGANPREYSPSVATASFSTVPYGVSAFIPAELLANADAPLKVELQYMRKLAALLKKARETRVATLLTTTGNFQYTKSLGSTTKWYDSAGGAAGTASDPIKDLLTIVEQSLEPVTHIVMSQKCFNGFILNPAVKAYLQAKNGVSGLPSPGEVTSANGLIFPGLPPITIARMKGKTAASTYASLWDDTKCVLLHRETALPADGETIMNAVTMRWDGGNIGDAQMSNGFIVRTFLNPFRGVRGGRQIVMTHNDAELKVTDWVGGLIYGIGQ